jgi:K+/H+ antiporter YhaU regulatory subunit KhtT
MASEYGVSPETIRRSMKLLEDMEVVDVKQNSGAIVLSSEKAKIYVDRFGEQNNIRTMRIKLNDLLEEQSKISQQIADIAGSIVKTNEKFSEANPFNSYEINIPENSKVIGHTVGELNFWQETRATIIAIRRDEKIILSPGPYALFELKDTIIFIGDVTCVQIVNDFINQ